MWHRWDNEDFLVGDERGEMMIIIFDHNIKKKGVCLQTASNSMTNLRKSGKNRTVHSPREMERGSKAIESTEHTNQGESNQNQLLTRCPTI